MSICLLYWNGYTRRIAQTTPHDSPVVSWCRRSRQNSNGVTPNGGAKCRWGRLTLATFDKSKTSTVASVVNLVRSQVYNTERSPLFAARLLRCSASRGFVSDSCMVVVNIRNTAILESLRHVHYTTPSRLQGRFMRLIAPSLYWYSLAVPVNRRYWWFLLCPTGRRPPCIVYTAYHIL